MPAAHRRRAASAGRPRCRVHARPRRSARIAPPSASASSLLPQPTRPATPTISPRAHLEGRVAAPCRRRVVSAATASTGAPCSICALVEEVVDLAADHHPHELVPRSSRGSGAVPIRRPSRSTVTREAAAVHLAQPVRDEHDRDAAARAGARGARAAARSRPPRASSSPRRARARASPPTRRAPPRPPAAARSRASPTRARGSTWTPSSSSASAREPARRGASRSSRVRRGSRPMRMFSATVSVGASVSSWLIATMPCSIACARAGERDGLAVDLDRAGVGLERAVEDLHERRLARAVLAGERVDLARQQLEVDAVEGQHARERLADARHAHERRASQDAARELDRLDREALPGLGVARTAARARGDVARLDRLDDLGVLGGRVPGRRDRQREVRALASAGGR